MRVIVTGAAGCLAKALLPMLCKQPGVTEVLGIDILPISFKHDKFRGIIGDIRQSSTLDAVKSHDAIVHLAFAIAREQRTEADMYDNNVNGTLRLFKAANSAGINKVINLSSVSVYGQGEDIVESTSLAPSSKFTYACHKTEIEQRATVDFRDVVHLRSHFIFGPKSHAFLHDLCNTRAFISLPRPVPRLQVVHEDDVAQAILLALDRPVHGAFNLAAPEVVTLPEFVKNGRRGMIPVPLRGLRAIATLARAAGIKKDFTWLDIIDTTLTVKCDRAARLLDWSPRFSAWETRAAMNWVPLP